VKKLLEIFKKSIFKYDQTENIKQELRQDLERYDAAYEIGRKDLLDKLAKYDPNYITTNSNNIDNFIYFALSVLVFGVLIKNNNKKEDCRQKHHHNTQHKNIYAQELDKMLVGQEKVELIKINS